MTGVRPKTRCLTCGRLVAVNMNGKIHKHACVARSASTGWAKATGTRAAILEAWRSAPDDAKPTLEAIGTQVGVTRERVRQILDEHGINTRAVRKAILARRRLDLMRQRFVAALADAATRPPCTVCDAWVIRGAAYLTCSHECAEVWVAGRYNLSADHHHAHRLSVARGYLRHPEKRKPSEIAWARRMLGPNPPPPNRRYAIAHKDLFQRGVKGGDQ